MFGDDDVCFILVTNFVNVGGWTQQLGPEIGDVVRLVCEQISWSKAESQQFAVRWLLYCLRHPDRELSRLQMISHLHAAWGEYRTGPRPL